MKKMPQFLSAVLCLLTALTSNAAGFSDKLRVLSVDLANSVVQTPGVPGGEISQELRNLLEKADPDVVCLQGVTDWESCERICKLKPGLRVLTCSAFPGTPQVAILAGERAVLSWVEEISEGSAFAFALVQTGSRKLGIFSFQSNPASTASAGPTDRVLAEIKKLQNFPQNRPDSFLIAGSPLVKSSALIDGGFRSISPDPQQPPSRSEFWVANAGFISRPRTVVLPGLRAPALACDFDSGGAFSSKFAYQTPLLFAGESPAAVQAPVSAAIPPAPANPLRAWAWPAAFTVLLLFVLVLFRKRRPSNQLALVPLNSADGLSLAGPANQEPLRANLLAWVKTVFVQRLLSQRQEMLSTEAEATRRTLVIEEKLSTLQTALQSRISAYETRIERLEDELTAATFENRDLIRSQIDLLKEKVAKAKEDHAYRRN